MRLVPCGFGESPDIEILDANSTANLQAQEAARDLNRGPDEFLYAPTDLSGLNRLIGGGIAPGQLWYAGAFSGDGKTAFFTSLALGWLQQGKKVYYVPTETPARVLRSHLACKSLGYDVGDFTTGTYLTWPNAAEVRIQLRAEINRMAVPVGDDPRLLFVADEGQISATRLLAEGAHAAELGADVFIVDHIDHVTGDGRSQYDTSIAANNTLLQIAKEYDLRVLAATQFNLEAAKGKRATRYMAPKDSYVYMGVYKRTLCHGMLGLYRPLKLIDLDVELLSKFNDGDENVKASQVLEPDTMGVYVMKHRAYGRLEGERCYLRVDRGRVADFSHTDREALEHGIRTSRTF